MDDALTSLKMTFTNINWAGLASHLGMLVIGFIGGFAIKFTALRKDRDDWKKRLEKLHSDFRKLQDMYVEQTDQKQKVIAERDEAIRLRNDALDHRHEMREKNHYMFAMLMREGIFQPEDHEYLNKKDIENITALFKKMKP